MAFAALPILGLGVLGFFMLAGDEAKKPTVPTEPPEITPGALEAMTLIRIVDGKPVRFFKPSMVNVIINMFNDSGLKPIPPPPAMPHAAGFEVLIGQPKPVNAAAATMQAANTGLVVLGTLELPFPQRFGRAIVIGQPGLIFSAHPTTRFAVLMHGPPGTPLPGVVPPGGGGGGSTVPLTPPELKPPQTDKLDAHLPATLRAQVEKMLADSKVDPFALEDAADAMQDKYPKTAAVLRARAAELRNVHALRDTQRGFSEHTIRSGDLPFKLAQHFTGDSSRWKELPKVNSHRGMKIVKIKGITQLSPWHGKIHLPVSWAHWNKRPAPVATGSLPTSSTAPGPSSPGEVQPVDVVPIFIPGPIGIPPDIPPDAGGPVVSIPPLIISPAKV